MASPLVRKKVKAYHLHEPEDALVSAMINDKKITNAKQSRSFVIGDMDEKDISYLQKQGLIVQVIEDDPIVKTPGTDAKKLCNIDLDQNLNNEIQFAENLKILLISLGIAFCFWCF